MKLNGNSFGYQGDIGEKCCVMLIDLVQDNKQIVDRIQPDNDLICLLKEWRVSILCFMKFSFFRIKGAYK